MTSAVAVRSAVQVRTVRLLMVVEVVSGLGVAMGISVGALLTRAMAGTALSGAAQSAAVVGGGVLAVPAAALMSRYGRRPGLALCYLTGAVGGVAVLGSALLDSIPLLFVGFFLFGAGSTAKLQSRYAATDLAEPHRRGRQLSLVVWSTTLGAVIGPNLASPLGGTLSRYGIPELAGPFAFAAVSFLLSALLLTVFLRPDPLLTAQALTAQTLAATDPAPAAVADGAQRQTLGTAARAVLASPAARLGMAAMALGHLVMVAVMAMTPVHIGETHSAPDTLRIVGFVLSVHVAGMYGLSPVVGWLTDRAGRVPVILGGVALLIAACAVAATAGHDTALLTAALLMLGLGWSGTMVAGSTLFTESLPAAVKARAQGLSDLVTGLSGASAGVLSGIVVELSGYAVLALLAALTTIPLIALALRPSTLAAVKVAD
ncbi:MFS transporter [Catellatospora citrea]|uniref:Tetracycline resistance protein n=1 Tax=Catellatospora citrea TaxID=53366 RepID=A0A8J3KDG8_9ACTN|nr:MFS transporter [Catellatospora citrea]RKE10034.1 putative MFS family arabinose efflux permease [Catellatospora citrea]GIF98056.1 tetracycline resistance protein [Catellatospora citrea]